MEIHTERLTLRPYQKEDLDDAMSVLGDEETMSFYGRPKTRGEVINIIDKNISTFQDSGYGLFAVIENHTGCFIGDCGITIQIIDGEEEFEVGYRISKERWGRGYAPEAAKAMILYGFETLRLTKLCSYMPKHHHQSRRTAEKSGMNLLKIFANPRNHGVLTTVYGIFKKDERGALAIDR